MNKSRKIIYWLFAILILVLVTWPFLGTTEKELVVSFFQATTVNELPLTNLPDNAEVDQDNSLIFGGDIMLSRSVNSKMIKYQDFSWPLKNVASIFSGADLSIANLESPFVYASNYQVPSGSFIFKADPRSVEALTVSGLDIVSLANNHILNQGLKGISDTKKILEDANISSVGLKDDRLLIKESKGIKFAFLAYAYSGDNKVINSLDETKLISDLVVAKKEADVIIVLMHAGTEYVREANYQQRNFAQLAIDNGADVVVGHHPHWPQTVEDYHGKKIFYSLGNLVFDQMWSPETREGLLVRLNFQGVDLNQVDYIPISIDDYGQANLVVDEKKINKLLQEINVLSPETSNIK